SIQLGDVDDPAAWIRKVQAGTQLLDQVPLQAQRVFYNAGLALSSEALTAYVKQLRSMQIHDVTVSGNQLQKALEPLYWPNCDTPLLRFTAEAGVAIARWAGSLQFKGFEQKDKT